MKKLNIIFNLFICKIFNRHTYILKNEVLWLSGDYLVWICCYCHKEYRTKFFNKKDSF